MSVFNQELIEALDKIKKNCEAGEELTTCELEILLLTTLLEEERPNGNS